MSSTKLADAIRYVSPDEANHLRRAGKQKHDSRLDDPDIEQQLPSHAAASLRQSARRGVNRELNSAVKGARRAAKRAAREVKDGRDELVGETEKFREYHSERTSQDAPLETVDTKEVTPVTWVETVAPEADSKLRIAQLLRQKRIAAESALEGRGLSDDEKQAALDSIRTDYAGKVQQGSGADVAIKPAKPQAATNAEIMKDEPFESASRLYTSRGNRRKSQSSDLQSPEPLSETTEAIIPEIADGVEESAKPKARAKRDRPSVRPSISRGR